MLPPAPETPLQLIKCLYAKQLGVSTKSTIYIVLICVALEQKRTHVKYCQWSICLCLLNNYFHVDSHISFANKMTYCPILTFEDDSTYKHAKDKSDCNSFSIGRAIEVQWVICRGFILISIS